MSNHNLQNKVATQDLISPDDQAGALNYQQYVQDCIADLFGTKVPYTYYPSICDFYYNHKNEL